LPYDFYTVIAYRIFLDNINEGISYYINASKPPKYVLFTPSLFDAWVQWYEILPEPDPKARSMMPLGTKIAPEWMKYEFNNLEEFYQHYMHITKEVE